MLNQTHVRGIAPRTQRTDNLAAPRKRQMRREVSGADGSAVRPGEKWVHALVKLTRWRGGDRRLNGALEYLVRLRADHYLLPYNEGGRGADANALDS